MVSAEYAHSRPVFTNRFRVNIGAPVGLRTTRTKLLSWATRAGLGALGEVDLFVTTTVTSVSHTPFGDNFRVTDHPPNGQVNCRALIAGNPVTFPDRHQAKWRNAILAGKA
jgi:hypothetical protein